MKSSYGEYCQMVAVGLGLSSGEKLVAIYGDMIQECFDAGDTVDDCIRYCSSDDEEYTNTSESRFFSEEELM